MERGAEQEDRRTSPRHRVKMIIQPGQEQEEGLIGLAGCGYRTAAPPSLGTAVNIRVALEVLGQELDLHGRVVFNQGELVGVAFEELDFDTERLIARYLDHCALAA